MKIFIWCLTFLVATTFNVLLGYATGWKVGYFLFYTLVYFVASRLCRIWDTHKANQQKNDTSYGASHPVSSVEETPPIASADIFHHPDTTRKTSWEDWKMEAKASCTIDLSPVSPGFWCRCPFSHFNGSAGIAPKHICICPHPKLVDVCSHSCLLYQ